MNNETQHTAETAISLLKECSALIDVIKFEEGEKVGGDLESRINEFLSSEVASAPSLLKENQELKAENERLKIYLEQTQYQDHSNIKSINEKLIKALEFVLNDDLPTLLSEKALSIVTEALKSKTEKP